MNLNIDFSKYAVPALAVACAGGALLMVSGMRKPVPHAASNAASVAEVRIPENLELRSAVPTMEQVVAKHLFVPERVATGENAFPDLLVKGVYVGESHRNAVFSLKSKPEANLRIWQGDEEAGLAQVVDERDPRKPIADFLEEWQIRSIDFSGVTLEHVITGEVETYLVDYKPLKQAKDSASAGYGQGVLADTAPPGNAKPAARGKQPGQPAQARGQAGGTPQAIAGRIGQYMQNLTPQQRQQFMQQLQKQNVTNNKKGNANSDDNRSRPSADRKNSGRSSGGGGQRRNR